MYAQNLIASGIQYLLDNTKLKIVIPCLCGNHGRITRKVQFATEQGNSLEFYMYHTLSRHFRNEPRVKFLISDGQHLYINIFGLDVRFMHGHTIRYQGGVGGLYIPANKAISQFDKAHKSDLTVFGHWHNQRDGGNFLVNGSMIGYNAFALSIKADYEPPKQTFFLIDKERGRTVTAPILFPKRRGK